MKCIGFLLCFINSLNMKFRFLFCIVLVSVVFSGCIKKEVQVASFEECVNAGFAVAESHPRSCVDSNGRIFTEVIKDEIPPDNQIVGGDRDEHGCTGSAGYSWCPAKQKCLRTWEEYCPMDAVLCNSSGGRFNECSSKCMIDNQGREGIACTLMCEQLCECGGIESLACPIGYECKAPPGIVDALGYCVLPGELSGDDSAPVPPSPGRPVEDVPVPSDAGVNRASDIARGYVLNLDYYSSRNGRNLEVLDVLQARCFGCWSVNVMFEADSDVLPETDVYTVLVSIEDWVVSDSSVGKETVIPRPPVVGIANPASIYCAEQGGTVSIVDVPPEGQSGYCDLPDGRSCEEWEFFNSEGVNCVPAGADDPTESMFQKECHSQCVQSGYALGTCKKSVDSSPEEIEISPCLIPDSDSCGPQDNCGCFCQV